jgi:hypothetical protein
MRRLSIAIMALAGPLCACVPQNQGASTAFTPIPRPAPDGFRYIDAQAQWVGRDDLATLRESANTARPIAYNCRPTRRTT